MSKLHNTIWFEKYRPKTIDNIIDQDKIKQFLNGVIDEHNIPHLLLYGPPGTGKTSSISILVRKLFKYNRKDFPNLNDREFNEENKRLYQNRVLELNVSNERGLKLLRGVIKNFAEIAINQGKFNDIAPFKIIILDEVDVMSHDAQDGLRRVMEDYSKNTRFILICNEVSKIYPPLLSRCTQFQFLPISLNNTIKIINNILLSEGYIDLNIDNDIYTYIHNYTGGDLRKTITIIQQLCTVSDIYNINIDIIREMIGEIPKYLIDNVIKLLFRKITILNQHNLYKLCDNIINDGYDCLYLMNHLFNYFLDSDIDDYKKLKIFSVIAIVNNRLYNFSSEFIQITYLLIEINKIINS